MPRVEHPDTPERCAEILRACASERRTVRVRGGGTKDHLGTLRETDVTLETGGVSGIVDHVPEDLTVTVRAGTRMDDLRDALATHGQFLPLDPPHVGRGATVGGVIAANSVGFGRHRYGGVRDLLLGVRAALPDGTIARAGGRVVKNVAGYDLNKLYIGSFGTLGVIVEATFKILPRPPVTAGTCATFANAADAFAAADAIIRTSLRPTALAVHRADDRRWRLVLVAAGERAPVDRAIAELARAAAARGAAASPIDDPDAELAPLREIVDAAATGAVIRAVLPLSAQSAFAEAAARTDPSAGVVADAASGIVQVHLRDETGLASAADALVANARVLGGSARVERGAGLEPMGGPEPGGAFLMRRLKAAFDPAGILEPARATIG
jgi:glycolate oxidase FAD binding subunit